MATTGSTRVALIAGMEQAKRTTQTERPLRPDKFSGSYALIWNSILRMNLTTMSATTIPAHPPSAAHRRSLAEKESQDLSLLRAKRDAQTDLVPALRNGVSENSVDSDGRQQQRGAREQRQGQSGKPGLRNGR